MENDIFSPRSQAKSRVTQLLQAAQARDGGSPTWQDRARKIFKAFESDNTTGSTEALIASMLPDAEPNRLRLPDSHLISTIIDLYFEELIFNSNALKELLYGLDASSLKELTDDRLPFKEPDAEFLVAAICEKPLIRGSKRAAKALEKLGLPIEMVGHRGEPRQSTYEVVQPFVPLPDLEGFQREVLERLAARLDDSNGPKRTWLTLPTGAGKTRTAVELLVSLMIDSSRNVDVVLWIAQSEELCEQAVQAFAEVWRDLGARNSDDRLVRPLTIGRYWDQRQIDILECDVIVATIQTLSSTKQTGPISDLRSVVDLVVIDEAHLAGAPSYRQVLRELGVEEGYQRGFLPPLIKVQPAPSPTTIDRPSPMLIGLTATPEKNDPYATRSLEKLFGGKPPITPTSPNGEETITFLRRLQVIAHVDHEVLKYEQNEYELTGKSQENFERFNRFDEAFLGPLALNVSRNMAIIDRVQKLNPEWPVLVFACNVAHAHALAALLQRGDNPRTTAAITGSTAPSLRRELIEQFRTGKLSTLTNVGVLTTGFDAPKVRCVVVARPTFSKPLYQQMIGRGLRGPRFGGTERCLIIDVDDHIRSGFSYVELSNGSSWEG